MMTAASDDKEIERPVAMMDSATMQKIEAMLVQHLDL